MRNSFLAIATLSVMSAGAMPALDLPRFGQTTTTCPQAGARKSRKPGSQDGSGPIHAPPRVAERARVAAPGAGSRPRPGPRRITVSAFPPSPGPGKQFLPFLPRHLVPDAMQRLRDPLTNAQNLRASLTARRCFSDICLPEPCVPSAPA
jgi:hypothetical protein